MDGSRGQASIFILIGIVLVLIAIFYMVSSSSTEEVTIEKGFDDISVDNTIKLCIDQEIENAAFLIGYQGGYVFPDGNALDIYVSNVSYWLQGTIRSPTNERVAAEIAYYLENRVPDCVKAAELQYQVVFQDVTSTVAIYDDGIYAEMSLQGSINKGDVEYKTGKYTQLKDIRLGLILEEAREKVIDLSDGAETVGVGDSELLFIANNFGDDLLYSVIDNKSVVHGDAYIFRFAVTVPEPDIIAPRILAIDPVTVKVGERVYIDVDTYDDDPDYQITYSLSSARIPDIDPVSGEITFVPNEPGIYQGIVSVIDGYWQEDHAIVYIEVTE